MVSGMNNLGVYMGMAASFMGEFNSSTEQWKKRILDEYEKTKHMPRKKKKARRKELNLDWSIACYDPFYEFYK